MATYDEIEIKALTPSDWELLRAIRIDMVIEYPGYFLESPEKAAARLESEWRARLDDKVNRHFGFFDKGNLAGIIGVFRFDTLPERTIDIGMLYVRPLYRGNGLSRYGYKACLDYAATLPDVDYAVVAHREGNAASRKVIEDMGFKLAYICEKPFGDNTIGKSWNYKIDITRGCHA